MHAARPASIDRAIQQHAAHPLRVLIMPGAGTLIVLCGKMAAGKSTLARELAAREDAVLLVQDEFLAGLYPGEIVDVPTFLERFARLQATLAPHIRTLLSRGLSVVLDFAGNTRSQRAWFRELVDGTSARVELHYIEASDALCKRQLKQRSAHLPPGTPWTSDSEFDAITAYFQAPADDEAFTVIRYDRG
jgi:predicted kinase